MVVLGLSPNVPLGLHTYRSVSYHRTVTFISRVRIASDAQRLVIGFRITNSEGLWRPNSRFGKRVEATTGVFRPTTSPLKTRTPALFQEAGERSGTDPSGGAGIRTPVRDKIDHSVYVRVPLIEVSSRWPMDSPLLDKSSKFSPTTGRRSSRLSRICDTLKAASGGLL